MWLKLHNIITLGLASGKFCSRLTRSDKVHHTKSVSPGKFDTPLRCHLMMLKLVEAIKYQVLNERVKNTFIPSTIRKRKTFSIKNKIMENNFILGSFLSVDHVNKLPFAKKSSIKRRMSLKGIKKIFKKKTGPPKVEIRRAFRRRSSMRSIEFWEESIIS